MEPRQGGRFHIWHMLGRERCLFATYALRKTVLSSARTARLNGLRGFGGLDLASAISSAPETITRPFLTAARMYILAKPVSL